GDRGVEVPILDDDVPALQRRAHDGGDVVRTVRGVQQRLGARGDVAAVVQHDVAHECADLRATGLSGAHDGASAFGDPLGEQRCLGGLPRAVAALEGDPEPRGHDLALAAFAARVAAAFLAAAERAAAFSASVFDVVAFLAAVALAGVFFAGAFFAGAFLAAPRLGAGPFARLSASIWTATS